MVEGVIVVVVLAVVVVGVAELVCSKANKATTHVEKHKDKMVEDCSKRRD